MKHRNLQPIVTKNQLSARFIVMLSSSLTDNIGMIITLIYRSSLIDTLIYRSSLILKDWSKFHLELVKLMDGLRKNVYPENFSDSSLKIFLDDKYNIKKRNSV